MRFFREGERGHADLKRYVWHQIIPPRKHFREISLKRRGIFYTFGLRTEIFQFFG
jgi:hypothetical protein